jgi:hypothetical protein
MKLVDIVEERDNEKEDLIIFQEDLNDYNSDVVLVKEVGSNNVVVDGKIYHYLIEMFLAIEFIEDWIQSLDYSPKQDSIAKKLHEYAINDA